MGLLDKFERSMERLLEGSSGSLFRQKLQPAQIGKRLEKAMIDRQQISMGSKIVPNAFRVGLNPKDFDEIEGYASGLSRQMENWLSSVAASRNFTLLDRISVELHEDVSAAIRNPTIAARVSDQRQPSRPALERRQRHVSRDPIPAQATRAFEVQGRSHTWDQPFELHITSGSLYGQSFALPDGVSTIGRSPDNSIQLDSPDVSRKHARIERHGDHLRVYDLNSTNRTRINGEAIHISDIESGDELRFGSVSAKVAASNRGGGW